MNEFFNSFSNREISIAIWFIVVLSVFIILSKSLKSFGLVIKAFFAKQLVVHYLVIIAYIYLLHFYLNRTILWEDQLFKDFIIWSIAFGFYSFFITNKIQTNRGLLEHFLKIFSFTVFVDFFLNYFTFSLGWEIILIPSLSFIIILQYFTENQMQEKDGYSTVNNFLKAIISISGFTLFFYCVYQLMYNYKDFLSNSSLKTFILPVILSVLYFPVIAIYAAYHKYENIYREVDRYQFIDQKRKRNIKLATIIYGNLNLDKLTRIRRWDKKEIQSNEDVIGYIRQL